MWPIIIKLCLINIIFFSYYLDFCVVPFNRFYFMSLLFLSSFSNCLVVTRYPTKIRLIMYINLNGFLSSL